MRVREATAEELAQVTNILDAAILQSAIDDLRQLISSGDVLVAVPEGAPESDNDKAATDSNRTIVGTVVVAGGEITAIAVRPGRRGQGIGRLLVETAADRYDRLVAEFDPRVRPFWEAVGFDIRSIEGSDRLRGTRE